MTHVEDVLPKTLQDSLNNIVRDEEFISHSIESRRLPPDGGSFMGILREITIKGETEDGAKELNLFVKSMIPDSELTIYSVPGAYEKETTVYRDLFKVFNELQEEANVPLEDRYYMPKSYEGVDSESIIMENLAKKGYTMCERLAVIPLKFAERTLQQLAKFHSMAFVIEAKRPEYFETKVKKLQQPFFYDTVAWEECVGNVSHKAMATLDPEAKEKVAAYLPTTYGKYTKYSQDPNSVRSLVHGDFRANNVMMKLNGNEITDIIPIDYQHTFYGCPMIDFLYFVFSGTDPEFREQHMDHLKNVYHDAMKRYLKYFNLDVEVYYPRREFERMYKERLDYGLMISLWLVPTILADKGEVPDVTTVDLSNYEFGINETVKTRVRGAVDEFIKWGYL